MGAARQVVHTSDTAPRQVRDSSAKRRARAEKKSRDTSVSSTEQELEEHASSDVELQEHDTQMVWNRCSANSNHQADMLRNQLLTVFHAFNLKNHTQQLRDILQTMAMTVPVSDQKKWLPYGAFLNFMKHNRPIRKVYVPKLEVYLEVRPPRPARRPTAGGIDARRGG